MNSASGVEEEHKHNGYSAAVRETKSRMKKGKEKTMMATERYYMKKEIRTEDINCKSRRSSPFRQFSPSLGVKSAEESIIR